MSPTYKQNKIHIYKWREHNINHYREYDAIYKKRAYAWKKIKMEFLAILII